MLTSKWIVAAASCLCVGVSSAVMDPVASASMFRGDHVTKQLSMGSKTVKISLNNRSGETMQVLVGEQTMTIEAGKTIEVKALVGAKIVNVTATKSHAAGEVLSEVQKSFDGATLHFS